MNTFIEKELGIKSKNIDRTTMEKAREKWASVAKPLNSLGLLEQIVIQLAGIYRTTDIDIKEKAVLVYCADNGVVAEGISQSGSEVTAMVAKSLAEGRSNVNIMAQSTGAKVFPVDIGMNVDVQEDRLIYRKVAYGTKNISKEPAMTREQCLQSIKTGIELVGDMKQKGIKMLAIGEMGIGNTTTSSAVASVLLNKSVDEMTGKGAGLTSEGLARKKEVISKAIELHNPSKDDAFEVLRTLGGFDIAAMAGTCIGGMIYDIPVILDGIISTVAALTATGMIPECRDYLIPSHVSKEPAGQAVLDAMEMEAIIHGQLCLGEGTGAVLLFPILDAVLAEYNSAHTFDEIELSPYEELK